MFVDFVGDYRDPVAFGDFEDVEEVIGGVDGAARVGGVVDDDRCGVFVDLLLEVSQVDYPVLVGLEMYGFIILDF